jgi:hypothetical protein
VVLLGKFGLYLSAILLIIYGLIEILPVLLMKRQKNINTDRGPKFIFKPLQDNAKMTQLLGGIIGVIRIIAAIGIMMNLMWGFALGVLICVITYAIMTFYLPFGIMDGVLSGIILLVLLITYFGGKTII